MRHLAISSFARILLAAAAFAVIPAVWSQQPGSSFASDSSTATDNPIAATNVAANASWHETTVPADRKINTRVTDGVLTVDGLVAKVQLNYDIHDAGFLYVFVPGVGTAVVSRVNSDGSVKVKDAFHGKTLAFDAGGHSFELTSATPLAEGKARVPKAEKQSKGSKKAVDEKAGKGDIYVRLDTASFSLDRNPMLGFGNTARAPFVWPLSGPPTKDTAAHLVAPPPLPASVLPRTVASNTSASLSSGRQ